MCDFESGKAHEPFIDDGGKFICVNSRYVSTQGVAVKYCTRNITPARSGDVLMVMSDLPNGRALAKAMYVGAQGNLAVNQRVCRLRSTKVNTKFLFYQLDRNPLFLMHDDGVNQTHLSNATFKKCPLLLPPILEQTQIAAFLDYETTKIDALIEKQQQLIALLGEKRQAVISHAVTKGLNPDAPMRDSGVEWLGQVPEHWTVKPIKWAAKNIQTGSTPPSHEQRFYDDGTLPWYGPSSFCESLPVGEPVKLINELAIKCGVAREFANSTVLVVGIGATIGKSAISHNRCSTNQQVNALTFDSSLILPDFVAFCLRPLETVFRDRALFTTMPIMNQSDLGSYSIPVPPINEQTEITKNLNSKEEIFTDSISRCETMLNTLQERRTALISAAVTGKIDVRGWKRPTADRPFEAEMELA